MKHHSEARLLCVANYPANTGFAWDFIEGLYAGLARRLEPLGVQTCVAYPRIDVPPNTLMGSPARPFVHEWTLRGSSGVRAARELICRERFEMVYLTDAASWHPAYASLRRAGMRRLVVHDHTSGARTPPHGLKRIVKLARHRIMPGAMADRVLAVSDYVARRKVEVDLVPEERVFRIWNSVEIPRHLLGPAERASLRTDLGVPTDGLLAVCACRTVREKGVAELLRAFDRLLGSWGNRTSGDASPTLLYLGDGPAMADLRSLHATLVHGNHVILAGYVPNAARAFAAADVAVVPSLWAEAFGLAALEPMAWGVPVVASAVGGIPEVVRDGVDGLLVPPGDELALGEALARLLATSSLREDMGKSGRARAAEVFSRDQQLDELEEIFLQELELCRAGC